MAVPIQPLEDFVVLQAETPEAKTASGFILPDNAKEKPKTAKVVAVGDGVKSVKVGDNVIYQNSYEATDVTVGKDDYIIIFKKNIIAIVK